MDQQVWRVLSSVLITVAIGSMGLVYRDLVRRLTRVERKSTACLMAMLVIMGKLEEVPPELLKTIQEALTDG